MRRRITPKIARQYVDEFEQRYSYYGRGHIYLAYHAAFPLALTPELLYLLWANFQRDVASKPLKVPWIAVADLLLSALCEEVGYELYEMEKAIRDELLRRLVADADRFGEQRLEELARFLLAYVRRQLERHPDDLNMQTEAEGQRWTALAYTRPNQAAKELALRLRELVQQSDGVEQIRMASVMETLAEPLVKAGFKPLVVYAKGMAHSARGQHFEAIRDYDQALHLAPDYSDAANSRQAAYQAFTARAQASYQQGLLDQAIADCTQLLRLNPRDVSLLVLRGQCYYQKGLLDEALADYDQALRLNSHDKEVQKHRQQADSAKNPPRKLPGERASSRAGEMTTTTAKSVGAPSPPRPLAPSPPRKTERVCAKDGMVQVYVPAGKFLMGSRDDDELAYDREKPQHEVYLDAYWIDKTPVTNAMFAKFVAETSYVTEAEKEGDAWGWTGSEWKEVKGAQWRHPRGANSNISGKDNHPVVSVSWNDAVAYAKWAERRLPTEAEWEKAAGGTDGRKWPWGNEPPTDKLCNFGMNVGDTTPVGNYPAGASPYGALDMAGNVWEWCHDNFEENYYASSPKDNPPGAKSQGPKVLRGGSWSYSARGTRARNRGANNADFRVVFRGFRC